MVATEATGRLIPMQGYEWLIVAALVLVLFGGSQIPKLARSLGAAQREFKQGLKDGAEEADAKADKDGKDGKEEATDTNKS